MAVKLSYTLHDKGNKPEQNYQTSMLTLHLAFFAICNSASKLRVNELYCNNVKHLLLPNTISQNNEKLHTIRIDDTAIPHHYWNTAWKKAQNCNNINPLKYDLRNSSDKLFLGYLYFKTKATLSDHSFTCAAPKLRNELPFDISPSTVTIIKAKLKTYLFCHAFLS